MWHRNHANKHSSRQKSQQRGPGSAAREQVSRARDHRINVRPLARVRAEAEADQVARVLRIRVARRPRDAPVDDRQRQAAARLTQDLRARTRRALRR